jgi:hypothetical protein
MPDLHQAPRRGKGPAPSSEIALHPVRTRLHRQLRRERAAHTASYRRVETLLPPDLLARLEALCARPDGSKCPSRRGVLEWVVSMGIDRAEQINAATEKRRATWQAKRPALAMKQASDGGAW